MHVVNGCDQWVWLMAVSIGGRFAGKHHHEVSLFLLSVSFFAPSFLLSYFLVKNIFRYVILYIMKYIFCTSLIKFIQPP